MNKIFILKEEGINIDLSETVLRPLESRAWHGLLIPLTYEICFGSVGQLSTREFRCKKEALKLWNMLNDAISEYKRTTKPIILNNPDPEEIKKPEPETFKNY